MLVTPLEQAAGLLGLPFLAGLRLPYGRALWVACPNPAPSPPCLRPGRPPVLGVALASSLPAQAPWPEGR